MRISLCNEVLAEFDFPRQCEIAKQLGYDGLEVAPFTLSPEPHLLSKERRKEIRKIAEDSGVPVTGLHYLLRAPEGLSITARDRAVRVRTTEIIRQLIGLAYDLGARLIVHGSPLQRKLEAGHTDEGRLYAIECWSAIADDAQQAGIAYCIEALARKEANFINTVEEAASIVNAIGNPAICTMIDCSAAAQTEAQSIPNLIRRWVPTGLIGHIHLNDPNRRGPGEGDLAFGPIQAALRETRYSGNAAIEPFIYIPDAATCAARSIGYMRGVIENGHARA